MREVDQNNLPHIKVITPEIKARADREMYIQRHTKSLLELLRDESPERAREIIERIRASMKLAA